MLSKLREVLWQTIFGLLLGFHLGSPVRAAPAPVGVEDLAGSLEKLDQTFSKIGFAAAFHTGDRVAFAAKTCSGKTSCHDYESLVTVENVTASDAVLRTEHALNTHLETVSKGDFDAAHGNPVRLWLKSLERSLASAPRTPTRVRVSEIRPVRYVFPDKKEIQADTITLTVIVPMPDLKDVTEIQNEFTVSSLLPGPAHVLEVRTKSSGENGRVVSRSVVSYAPATQ